VDGRNNEPRKFYKEIDWQRSTYEPEACGLKDSNGTGLTVQEEVLERWREYFDHLLNEDELAQAGGEMEMEIEEVGVDAPSIEEVQAVIMKQKNHKAAGTDGIPAELIKAGGDRILRDLTLLIEHVWREEQIPEEWGKGIIIPIFKKKATSGSAKITEELASCAWGTKCCLFFCTTGCTHMQKKG
jgi:hypothetical protein